VIPVKGARSVSRSGEKAPGSAPLDRAFIVTSSSTRERTSPAVSGTFPRSTTPES